MDNYENNNTNDYTNPNEEEVNQPQKFDPAGETKTKILFLIIAIVIMVAVKFYFRL